MRFTESFYGRPEILEAWTSHVSKIKYYTAIKDAPLWFKVLNHWTFKAGEMIRESEYANLLPFEKKLFKLDK